MRSGRPLHLRFGVRADVFDRVVLMAERAASSGYSGDIDEPTAMIDVTRPARELVVVAVNYLACDKPRLVAELRSLEPVQAQVSVAVATAGARDRYASPRRMAR